MKRIARPVLVSLFGALLAGQPMGAVAGSNQGGTSTAAFLRIGQGARAEAMGGAFTAVANDAHAIHFNPAGLAQITKRQVALDHLSYIEEMSSQYAAFVLPVNQVYGSLGVDATYVNMGSIDRMDSGGLATNGDTKVDAMSGTVAWGQALGDRVAIGFGGKFFRQNLAGEKASGFAGDAGALVYLVPNRLIFGASALNIGSKVEVGTLKENLPLTARGGFSAYAIPKQLLFSVEAEKERDTDTVGRVGAEYVYMGRFVGRAGYRDPLGNKGGLSAGLGFIWRPSSQLSTDFFGQQDKVLDADGFEIRLDYAYVDYGDFDATHRFGILFAF